jgi:hypothetical protein
MKSPISIIVRLAGNGVTTRQHRRINLRGVCGRFSPAERLAHMLLRDLEFERLYVRLDEPVGQDARAKNS